MHHESMIDLDECTEFRQALRLGTPALVHGTAILLMLLLGTAIGWMALTKANLIVRAQGRVRPVTGPGETSDDFSEEVSCEIDGRVVEVHVEEGDEVGQGAPLLRLDAERLDNQIERLQGKIVAGDEELAELMRLGELLGRQHASARSRAEAEWADKESRARKLAARKAITDEGLVEAKTQTQEARGKLRKAMLPLEEGRLQVLEHAVDELQRKNQVKLHELDIQRRARQAVVEVDQLELRNLELDRRQAVVRAPSDGIVTTVNVKVGDLVSAGKVGITTVPQRELELVMSVTNEDVGLLQVGMPARVKLDACDYQKYGVLTGRLRFVSPDSQVQEDAKANQRAIYKVKVALDRETYGLNEHRAQVKLGMTGQAEIITDQECFLLLLLRKIRQSISLS